MSDKNLDYEYVSPEEPENKNSGFTKGFYVVLALCICAIGIAGWFTYADVKNYMEDDVPKSVITSSEPQNKQAEAKISGVEKETEVVTEEPTEEPTEEYIEYVTESISEDIQQTDTEKVSPVGDNREVVWEYSAEKFVYFESLKDWRLHKGIDYAIEDDGAVYSVTSGEVKDVVDDSLYGKGIVIQNNDGYVATYLGVKPADNIAIGLVVKSGDIIGTATEIPCEKKEKSHIHFEVKKDGNCVNPEEYLNNEIQS